MDYWNDPSQPAAPYSHNKRASLGDPICYKPFKSPYDTLLQKSNCTLSLTATGAEGPQAPDCRRGRPVTKRPHNLQLTCAHFRKHFRHPTRVLAVSPETPQRRRDCSQTHDDPMKTGCVTDSYALSRRVLQAQSRQFWHIIGDMSCRTDTDGQHYRTITQLQSCSSDFRIASISVIPWWKRTFLSMRQPSSPQNFQKNCLGE